MEASVGGNPDTYNRGSSRIISNSRRYGMNLSASNFFRSPVTSLLEYAGILRTRPNHQDSDSLLGNSISVGFTDHHPSNEYPSASRNNNNGEVSIRIIGAGEQERDQAGSILDSTENEVFVQSMSRTASTSSVSSTLEAQGDLRTDIGGRESLDPQSLNGGVDADSMDGSGVNSRDSSSQRYDIQQAARMIEQVLPFSLLLLIVFIRQHLQGFFVTIWVAAVLFKSNGIVQKQTALKGERKIIVLVGISLVFALHIFGVYWLYQNDDLLYPLVMIPPKSIPPFWHAVFIIMVNDTLVRQATMIIKCILLMYYKNSKGRKYRKQGQMLTLVEYTILLYRALLPAPIWYRFFLDKEYGSLFSSLMTGLYLTFKLTSIVEKVQCFFTALKALSHKEIHYGSYATMEQVNAVGDLCTICQEKMHAPIMLRCKHIFCEDCVSEWFERERTCPLCRALVKAADLRSFGDGSTTLSFQFF
ncbi:E3 ubiquitin-protein ligase RNFT1-like [Impatiens glandulifera]|uniref:E3 ubiquitin-protein ligase RNFT1-like n=1 Tax=Impatiens glandulifera TaxID=253017 RepID=UPI001FB17A7E|nr:E3 ubiquitin-protein ligase RNFT1-like [Impatiens glandulifera]